LAWGGHGQLLVAAAENGSFCSVENTKGIYDVVMQNSISNMYHLFLYLVKNTTSQKEKGVRWNFFEIFPPTIPRERRAQTGVHPKWLI